MPADDDPDDGDTQWALTVLIDEDGKVITNMRLGEFTQPPTRANIRTILLALCDELLIADRDETRPDQPPTATPNGP